MRPWVPLVVIMTLCSGQAMAAELPLFRTTAPLHLVNYPGDAPGTKSIDEISKSTQCQERGYLRYSQADGSCLTQNFNKVPYQHAMARPAMIGFPVPAETTVVR